jgi:hypothetical protein
MNLQLESENGSPFRIFTGSNITTRFDLEDELLDNGTQLQWKVTPTFYCKSISTSCDSNVSSPMVRHGLTPTVSSSSTAQVERIRSTSPTDEIFVRNSPRELLIKKMKYQNKGKEEEYSSETCESETDSHLK